MRVKDTRTWRPGENEYGHIWRYLNQYAKIHTIKPVIEEYNELTCLYKGCDVHLDYLKKRDYPATLTVISDSFSEAHKYLEEIVKGSGV